jgi:hypothetical protein
MTSSFERNLRNWIPAFAGMNGKSRGLVVGLLIALLHISPAVAQVQTGVQNQQIETAYKEPRNPSYRPIYDRLTKRRVLEELAQFLAPLRLPRKLTVKLDECGAQRLAYKRDGPIIVCYEVVDEIDRVAANVAPDMRGTLVAGAFIEVVLHEVALGVLDVLHVPVWGRAEDAADRLAALVMLQFGQELALRAITATALFFKLSGQTWTGSSFAAAESPEAQRFYNYLCIAYGGDPLTFRFLVQPQRGAPPDLPAGRARRCTGVYGEYHQVRKAFDLRVMPFIDPDLLIKARSTEWLLPGDIK